MPKVDSAKINQHLAQDKIRVRMVAEGGLNSLRVSFFICNHAGEVDRILGSLRKLA
jgi:selenocysteine lyase/cysteine desulfurase